MGTLIVGEVGKDGYEYEGVACQVHAACHVYAGFQYRLKPHFVPLHHFRNDKTGAQLLVTTASNKIEHVSTLVNKTRADGFHYVGVLFYIQTLKKEGTVPLHRYYNLLTGNYFYTTSACEIGTTKPHVIGTYKHNRFESIVGYVVSRKATAAKPNNCTDMQPEEDYRAVCGKPVMDKDSEYGDITEANHLTVGECCDWCKSTPNCTGFVWQPLEKHCWLKHTLRHRNYYNTHTRRQVVHVIRLEERASCGKPAIGMDSFGNEILESPMASSTECCDWCKSTSHCVGFVWASKKSHCWLKHTLKPHNLYTRAYDRQIVSVTHWGKFSLMTRCIYIYGTLFKDIVPPLTTTPPTYHVTYRLAEGDENWPADKRAKIVVAMDAAVALYNQMGEFDKQVTASYNRDVSTADGHYNGNIRFGGQISKRVALHELGHVMGIGQHPKCNSFIVDGKWTGAYALAHLHAFDGPDAVLHADRQHFWPYGLNYDKESSPQNDQRHVLMVAAFRRDFGIVNGPRGE